MSCTIAEPHTLRIGRIDYINTIPLFGGFLSGAVTSSAEWHADVPTALNRSLREGKIDLSLVSSVEYLDHHTDYDLLPGLCIAASGKVMSVNLYHQGSLESLDGKKVCITTDSAISVALLKVLCHHYWHIHPVFVAAEAPHKDPDAHGFLLIGDEALCRQTFPQHTTVDLAEEWYKATKLPFVFAIFAVRKETSCGHLEALDTFQEELASSMAWAEAHPDAIIALAMEHLDDKEIDLATVREYYRALYYSFGSQEEKGLHLFDTLRRTL